MKESVIAKTFPVNHISAHRPGIDVSVLVLENQPEQTRPACWSKPRGDKTNPQGFFPLRIASILTEWGYF